MINYGHPLSTMGHGSCVIKRHLRRFQKLKLKIFAWVCPGARTKKLLVGASKHLLTRLFLILLAKKLGARPKRPPRQCVLLPQSKLAGQYFPSYSSEEKRSPVSEEMMCAADKMSGSGMISVVFFSKLRSNTWVGRATAIRSLKRMERETILLLTNPAIDVVL